MKRSTGLGIGLLLALTFTVQAQQAQPLCPIASITQIPANTRFELTTRLVIPANANAVTLTDSCAVHLRTTSPRARTLTRHTLTGTVTESLDTITITMSGANEPVRSIECSALTIHSIGQLFSEIAPLFRANVTLAPESQCAEGVEFNDLSMNRIRRAYESTIDEEAFSKAKYLTHQNSISHETPRAHSSNSRIRITDR